MRGEHKTLGGKLVAVELSLRAGCLADVRISGDFFLYPEEALERIAAALDGAPAEATAATLAERVRVALPAGAELLGSSPEAVGLAVRQAWRNEVLAGWRGAGWRLLPEVPLAPALNLALDEVLTQQVAAGQRGPTLRFWGWAAEAVVIGRFQSLANEVDADEARARGVQVVRRMSGGGAMLVQPGRTITYSLYLPEALLAGLSIAESYEACDAWVVEALQDMGVPASYVPLNDIAAPDGKIGGAAQARRPGAVLHHTTIADDLNGAEMMKLLRIGRVKLSDKGIASAAKRVSPLRRHTTLPRGEIVARLTAHFRTRFGLTDETLGETEIAAGEELARTKYGTGEWTGMLA